MRAGSTGTCATFYKERGPSLLEARTFYNQRLRCLREARTFYNKRGLGLPGAQNLLHPEGGVPPGTLTASARGGSRGSGEGVALI
jgi:hypothetical protein